MCDKTGTLTRNVMKFKRCSIAGENYGDDEADEFMDYRLTVDTNKQKVFVQTVKYYIYFIFGCPMDCFCVRFKYIF